ncbi:MAG: MurR/RpiR family transcriptional regulator [Spirochaetia bacterium]|jgi:DNA-binding MurR/RpiR family transcriptional regulator|nr:MurR/RpiR family transcriptional regulator [Spirochaetia bacterium]
MDHNESCLQLIKTLYPSFSKKEKIIADYILNDPSLGISPSIDSLAENIGISESTLVRFAKKLGYTGYQQFRIALVEETVKRESNLFELPINKEDDEIDIIFSAAISTLQSTQKYLDRNSIKKASKWINEADKTIMLGLGGSNIVSEDAFHKLMRTGINCVFAQDFHIQLMLVSQLTKNDVVLVTSHTGVNKDTMSLMDEAKEKGSKIILLTSNKRSPLAMKADLVLSVSVTTQTPVAESFTGRIAQMMIIDTVYVELMKIRKTGMKSLESMRDIIASRRN